MNLFLYDIREAKELRPIDWEERMTRGAHVRPAPAAADRRLVRRDGLDARRPGRAPAALAGRWRCSTPSRPCRRTCSPPSLANGSQRYPLKTRTAQERHEDASDFWTAVGGQYKASFNYVVTLSCEPGVSLERGPEVQDGDDAALRPRLPRSDAASRCTGSGGTVVDGDGMGVRNVWVHLQETGQLAVTDAEGRFRFDRLKPGSYTVAARGPDGKETKAKLAVPGPGRRDHARRVPRRRRQIELTPIWLVNPSSLCPKGRKACPESVPLLFWRYGCAETRLFTACPDGL